MARNLEATGGLILAERVTTALTAHVDDAREIVTRVATSGTRLDQDPTIAEYLTVTEVAELTDPTNYLGHAVDLVDRALAVRERGTLR